MNTKIIASIALSSATAVTSAITSIWLCNEVRKQKQKIKQMNKTIEWMIEDIINLQDKTKEDTETEE